MRTKDKIELEKLFLSILKENAGDFVLENFKKYEVLYERKKYENFKLTPNKVRKLNHLNNILSEMEIKLSQKCREIELNILNKADTKLPSKTCNIDIEIFYYSTKIISKYKKEELDYILKKSDNSIYLQRRINKKIEQIIYPYTYRGSVLVENSCGTFRALADSYLTFEEILSIDKIWWDVNVSYYFKKDIKKFIKMT